MAILGYDTQGSNATCSSADAGRKYGTKFTLAEDGDVSELHCWVFRSAFANSYTLSIYEDNAGSPDALVYCTSLISLGAGAGGALNMAVTGLSVPLTAGDYWLTWAATGGTGDSIYGEDTGGTHKGITGGAAVNPVSDPFGATDTSGTRKHSIWAVYSAGSPPECTVDPEVTGTPTWGETLACSEGTWTGSPTPTFTYQWKRSDHGEDDYSAIASATSDEYTPVAADIGKDILCTVTGTNSEDAVDANSNAVGPIAADSTTADGIEAAITSGEWTVTINPAITWRGGLPLHPATYNAERLVLGVNKHLSARDGDNLVSACNAFDATL